MSSREILILCLCFSFRHGGGTGADSGDSHGGCRGIHSPGHSYFVLLNHRQVTDVYQIISKMCEKAFLIHCVLKRFSMEQSTPEGKGDQGPLRPESERCKLTATMAHSLYEQAPEN